MKKIIPSTVGVAGSCELNCQGSAASQKLRKELIKFFNSITNKTIFPVKVMAKHI